LTRRMEATVAPSWLRTSAPKPAPKTAQIAYAARLSRIARITASPGRSGRRKGRPRWSCHRDRPVSSLSSSWAWSSRRPCCPRPWWRCSSPPPTG
jgi:hypothetical protein